MASQVDVANGCLTKLGTRPITSVSDSSQEARAVAGAWERLRDAELRAHPWKFSIQRKLVGALTEAPAFGYTHQFELPAGYLRLVEIDGVWCWDAGEKPAWQIEGRRLLLDHAGPIRLRWAGVIENVGLWDPLFVEVMVCRLATELCEKLTGSDSKKNALEFDYQKAVRIGRQTDAIERAPQPPRDGSWITGRA